MRKICDFRMKNNSLFYDKKTIFASLKSYDKKSPNSPIYNKKNSILGQKAAITQNFKSYDKVVIQNQKLRFCKNKLN